MSKLFLLFGFVLCVLVVQARSVVINPDLQNTGMPHNDDYTVRVRVPGGTWQDLFEYNVQVDMDRVQDASMVQFDIDGQVEVMVKRIMEALMRYPFVLAVIKLLING